MIDPEGQKLIRARNGLGALAKPIAASLTPEDTQQLARMQTDRQARAVLGAVAFVLRKGYETALPLFGKVVDKVGGVGLQAGMKSLLDQVNGYAQKVYARIPDDDAPLSPQNRKSVELTLAQARDAVATVDEAARTQGFFASLSDALTDAIRGALDSVLPAPWRNLDTKTKNTVIKIGLGVAVLFGVYVVAKLVTNIALRGSDPNEMDEVEQTAIDLAAAQRRKRSARRAISIS